MAVPSPVPIYRFIHMDNLQIYLKRGGMHAPDNTPDDGLIYRTIHNPSIQSQRHVTTIPCGPGGCVHDYVPFYFGPRTPMLYQLHTAWEIDYREGQEPLIYLVSTAQEVERSRTRFVFSDGHGIAHYTAWFDSLEDLDKVDWKTVYAGIWRDIPADMDRQRRKQAEFLIHQFCDWSLIQEIGVINAGTKQKVELILQGFPVIIKRPVIIRRMWYY